MTCRLWAIAGRRTMHWRSFLSHQEGELRLAALPGAAFPTLVPEKHFPSHCSKPAP